MLSVALIAESECFRVALADCYRYLMRCRIAALAPTVFTDAPQSSRSGFAVIALIAFALRTKSAARVAVDMRLSTI